MLSLLILALIQSFTEFLPVSSSGHLLLLPFFGLSEQGLGVDVALHVGTLIAVVFYFFGDLWKILQFKNNHLLILLIAASIPVALMGLSLSSLAEHYFRSPIIVGASSIFFGILLWRVDVKFKNHRKIDQMSIREAFLIGCAQMLALIPGTSRSGITITCARWLGFKREESARFSMLLSIPTISMAALYMGWKAYMGEIVLPPALDLSLAVFVSGFFGLLAIAFLMKWVQRASFFVFTLYRVILGLFLIIFFWN